jgi:hypothetical protein
LKARFYWPKVEITDGSWTPQRDGSMGVRAGRLDILLCRISGDVFTGDAK